MHRIVVDFKAERPAVREAHVAQLVLFEVHDPIALGADQMMVAPDIAVEAGRGPHGVRPANHSQAAQGVQHPIDGRHREFRQTPPDCLMDLFRRGMIAAREDGLENDTALHGQGNAAVSTKLFKFVQSLLIGSHRSVPCASF